ncbi:polyprenyl synthetase family protein [Kitasatospora sp. NA04385]|uniref:polyprenyl synthetase family protein n=1 Tax=Kitasatospora sp. NA04385 TaxID=2742135 RepID=UPI001163C10D|nr:polyprenyl synthetase family protein [Kitasatospora sp. NA04385]QDJ74287.1 putative polyprenyl diphosphate synthase [Kitasatospora sp.]QKW22418.1 polyprenyl synthetase family protein [Kitasatospora sp. NA04385]
MTALTAGPRPDSALVARLALADREFADRLRHGLAEAETRLREVAADVPDALIAEWSRYLIEAGGKRLRPLLVLLAAEFGPAGRAELADRARDAAALVELVHVASLHHDDVMDGARSRHGVPSAPARWGNRTAVALGNRLLVRAARLAAELGQEVSGLQGAAAERLVRGQLRELTGPAEGESPLTHHFEVIADKTASLISLALRTGATVAGAPAPAVRALAEYGEHLGTVFQLSDDLLDFEADPVESGKDPGTDLAVGVRTLPVLLALSEDGPRAAELRGLLEGGPLTDEADRRRAAELLRGSTAAARARELLHSYATDAREALSALPDRPARDALAALVGVVEHRAS